MGEQGKTEFWNRVCESLFIKSPGWFGAVRTLPDKLDLAICLKRTVSGEAVTGTTIRALGWVGHGITEESKPNPLRPTDMPLTQLQWAFIQILCQFLQFEGIYNYLTLNCMSNPELWSQNAVEQFIELTQTMTFYSSMLIIAEEGRLPDNEDDLEPLIREEVRKIVGVLTSKTTDYGQAFLRHGVLGLLNRVWDKIARYATLSAENRPAKFESRKDTAMDMLGYSVLIWSILEDMKTSSTNLCKEINLEATQK